MSKIVCIGDSLTQGYNIPMDHAWPSILRTKLNVEIINSGISGDTTAGMLARMERDVHAYAPTHMIIMGGTNDVSFRLSDEVILSNIYTIIKQAKYHGIQALIGLPTSYYPPKRSAANHLFSNGPVLKKRIDLLHTLLKKLALTDNMPFIDFGDNITSDHYLVDGMHPNQSGHEIMAQNAHDVLKSLDKIK